MAHSTFVLLCSIGLVVVVLALTALHWRRMHSTRTLLQGLGVALFVAALQVIGFMEVVYTWVRATIHWVLHTAFDGTRMVGLGIGALGVVLFLVGMLVSPVSRADAKQRRLARKQAAGQVGTGTVAGTAPSGRRRPGAQPVVAKAPATAKAPTAATASGATDEDDEIEAILRSHGIQ